jgi:hypothetical protein
MGLGGDLIMPAASMKALFLFFALFTQGMLLLNFAARRWHPALEARYGWTVYALGLPALILGLLFLAHRQPWPITSAPFVFAGWAGFGFYVDRIRRISWRSPPRWPILLPYVVAYLAAQFLFWVPLWEIDLAYWVGYTILYTLNTVLNLSTHGRRRRTEQAV